MVERSLSMREVQGSIPCISITFDGWAFSSVVERPFRIRKVEGSNPSSSTFSLPTAKSGHRESNPGFHGHNVVF